MQENPTREIFESFGNNIKDLYDLALRKDSYSAYVDQSSEEQMQSVIGELQEVLEEIKNNNNELVEKELNDAIFVLIMFVVKLRKEGRLSDDFLENFGKLQKEKVFSRSPHLKSHEKLTKEKEDELRYAMKLLEK